MGQMSASKQRARGSAELNRPGSGFPSRERSLLGLEKKEFSILPQEDVEEFGEFLHDWKPKAVLEIRSFEDDGMLKKPPPYFVLGPEHWLGLHEEIPETLFWQAYRLVNPTTFVEAKQSLKVVEAISRAREELAEIKASEVFEEEHERKRSGLQSQLEETARRMWTHDRVLRDMEKRIAGADALVKELEAEVAAASTNQRETYEQHHRYCREWRAEESKVEA